MSKRVRFSGEAGAEETVHKFPKYDDASTKKFELKNNQEDIVGRSHHQSRFKLDHSLDSDEEDNNKKEDFEKLTEEDVEGAEDDYVDTGEEVGITPFNLKEEMAEGDFDVQGNYHFRKENVIRDNWLDNIDWMKVKKKDVEMEQDSSDDGENTLDELEVLKKIVALMLPGETLTRALRRHGGKEKKKRSWRKEKVYDLNATNEETSTSNENDKEAKQKEKLLELTGLADEMTGAGHYDVYTDTYEKFQHKIEKMEAEKKAKEPVIPDDADDDDALDILASNIDETDKMNESGSTNRNENSNGENVIKWEFKWTEEDSEIHGPFTSQEMFEWQEQGYFKDGVLVRRTDRDESQFYSSKRIDFDLYT
ncbi:CD2 antigen cytoplasmic tail-binding protein 2 homolog [Styela clava]